MKRLPLVPLLGAAIIAVDQLTKWIVVSNLPVDRPFFPIPPLSGIFAITFVTNSGIAFGLFKEVGTFFILLAVIAVALILFSVRRLPAHHRLVRVALGLALGGAIGNLVDRVRLGYVVDFIDLRFFPIFNLADSAIVIGMVLLAISLWHEESSPAGERLPG